MRKYLIILLFFISQVTNAQTFIFGLLQSRVKAQFITGTDVIGDSFTSEDGTLKWLKQLATALGITTYNNYALGATGCRKQLQQYLPATPPNTTTPLVSFAGFNDVRVTSGQTIRYEHVNAATRAAYAAKCATTVQFPFGGVAGSTVNPHVSFSDGSATVSNDVNGGSVDFGSWSQYFKNNITAYNQCGYFNKVVATNETITVTNVFGSDIAIGTWGCDPIRHLSRFTVTVDGAVALTYDPNGKAYYGAALVSQPNPDGYMNDAIVFHNLSNTNHTIVITFLDGGNNGMIDWLGTLKNAASAPLLVLMDVAHMNNIGYTTISGFQTNGAILDGATTSRWNAMQTAYPGYPISRVRIGDPGFYEPETNPSQIQSDGVHPSIPTGAGKIKDAYIFSMN